MILSLDPSSMVVGFAVFADSGALVQAGLIEPEQRRAESYWRIRSLVGYLRQVLDEVEPSVILIEWTKGKVGKIRHTGNGAGLAVYGAGVGAVASECEHWSDGVNCRVVPVLENVWTRGVPKKSRQAAIACSVQIYKIESDPGGDISDAIGLGQWWLKEKLLFSAVK